MAFLTDGHPTLIQFALDPLVKFKEKMVTPPGLDGGGANDTTTFRNNVFRTMQPKKLVTLTEMSLTAQYDPDCYDSILNNLLNKNGVVTVRFSDGSLLDFYGYLNHFKPNQTKEGEMPTAEISVIPTNQDNSGVEQAPVFTG